MVVKVQHAASQLYTTDLIEDNPFGGGS